MFASSTASTKPSEVPIKVERAEVQRATSATVPANSEAVRSSTDSPSFEEVIERNHLEELEARATELLANQLKTLSSLPEVEPERLDSAKRWLVHFRALAMFHGVQWSNPMVSSLDQVCVFEWALRGRQLLVSIESDAIRYDGVIVHDSHFEIEEGVMVNERDNLDLLRVIAG